MADWPYSTTTWQRLRKVKLAAAPLCQPCSMRGCIVAAIHVDHVTSIASGGPAFPSLDGLMSLCHGCHSVKTNAVDRAGGSGLRFKGCGPDGLPVDPGHPAFGGHTPSKDQQGGGKDRPNRRVFTKFRGQS